MKWNAMSGGVNNLTNNNVFAIYAFDASNVYIGGNFTSVDGIANTSRIAKWNGTSWSSVGGGITSGTNGVVTIHGFDLNNIYVGGDFTSVPGVSNTSTIAKWDGTSWSSVISISFPTIINCIYALNANNVYIGGKFSISSDTSTRNLFKWNGTSASSMYGGITTFTSTRVCQSIYALDETNVYVALNTTLYKWNGTTFETKITTNGKIYTIYAPNYNNVYVGGQFTDPSQSIFKLNVSSNTVVDLNYGTGYVNYSVKGFDENNVYIGGTYTRIGPQGAINVNYVAKWNGLTWISLRNGTNNYVRAVYVLDANNVYVGGDFTTADGITVNKIARWGYS